MASRWFSLAVQGIGSTTSSAFACNKVARIISKQRCCALIVSYLVSRRPRHWKGTSKALGNKMCHVCKAASLHSTTSYTNVFPGSGWWGTNETHSEFLASLDKPNRLAQSVHFRNHMIFNDTLHVVYRGYLPEFVGSAIMELAKEKFWSTGSLQANLDAAFRSCKLFLESTKLGQLSLDDFSKSSLDGEEGFPSLPGKGHDAKLVALWLPRQTKLWLQKSPSDHARVLDLSLGGKRWLWFLIWFNFVAKRFGLKQG